MPTPLYNMVNEIFWYQITSAQLPFPCIQLERTFGGDIYAQSPVVFDHILLSNGSIDCNTVNGDISIYICGEYFVKWFVVPQEGLSTDGGDFSIVGDNSKDRQGSSHMKNAPVSGIAIAVVESAPYTLRLINTSDSDIVLSNVTLAKAGLAIVKIGGAKTPAASGLSGIPQEKEMKHGVISAIGTDY